jgi:hypothetical protein
MAQRIIHQLIDDRVPRPHSSRRRRGLGDVPRPLSGAHTPAKHCAVPGGGGSAPPEHRRRPVSHKLDARMASIVVGCAGGDPLQ